jgi:hypothetical protein
MWKSVAIPVALAVASAAAPAQAATLVQVSTTNSMGWTVITPDGTVDARETERNPNWANVPWISPVTSGNTNIAPGNYTYVYKLTPGLFKLLTGTSFVDNRLLGIFVNGTTLVASFDPNSNGGEFQFREGNGRSINLDLSTYGTVSEISFLTQNDPLPGGAANPGAFSFVGSVTAVPEPGTWMLMILGLGAVGFAMRRRQSVSARVQFA